MRNSRICLYFLSFSIGSSLGDNYDILIALALRSPIFEYLRGKNRSALGYLEPAALKKNADKNGFSLRKRLIVLMFRIACGRWGHVFAARSI